MSEKGNAFLRPLKKKGLKEERVTTVRLDDLGKTTTLESNKSQKKIPGESGGYSKGWNVSSGIHLFSLLLIAAMPHP